MSWFIIEDDTLDIILHKITTSIKHIDMVTEICVRVWNLKIHYSNSCV